MNNEYRIFNATPIQQRIEELEKQLNTLGHTSKEEIHAQGYLSGKIQQLRETLYQSTPLIPEIEKAFTAGERYGWDSQKSIGNIDEMREKIKLQSLDNYITNLKLDI